MTEKAPDIVDQLVTLQLFTNQALFQMPSSTPRRRGCSERKPLSTSSVGALPAG